MMFKPRVIVGLGNPGKEYAATPHNAGFWVTDALVEAHRGSFRGERKFRAEIARLHLGDSDISVLKPLTYMNLSGESVQPFCRFLKLSAEDLLVIHDDLDLPPGTLRLKDGGGHGGHNGLRSLTQHVGSAFRRLRFGIGHPGHRDAVLSYVLSRPGPQRVQGYRDAVARSVEGIELLQAQGWGKAAQALNTRAREKL